MAFYSSTRELLRELGATEMLKKQEQSLQVYFDRSLFRSSRIAGDCIQEGHLFDLLQKYKHYRTEGALLEFIRLVFPSHGQLASF